MNGLIPCLGTVGIVVIVFGFLALVRYLSYRETLARAEKGLPRPGQKTSRRFLRWGILITGLSSALSAGLYSIGFSAGNDYPLHLGPWMLGGFVPLFLGLSLILLHLLTQRD